MFVVVVELLAPLSLLGVVAGAGDWLPVVAALMLIDLFDVLVCSDYLHPFTHFECYPRLRYLYDGTLFTSK